MYDNCILIVKKKKKDLLHKMNFTLIKKQVFDIMTLRDVQSFTLIIEQFL